MLPPHLAEAMLRVREGMTTADDAELIEAELTYLSRLAFGGPPTRSNQSGQGAGQVGG